MYKIPVGETRSEWKSNSLKGKPVKWKVAQCTENWEELPNYIYTDTHTHTPTNYTCVWISQIWLMWIYNIETYIFLILFYYCSRADKP